MIPEIRKKLSSTYDFIANHYWPLLIIFTPILGIYEIIKIVLYKSLSENIFTNPSIIIFIINFFYNGLLLTLLIFIIDQIYTKNKFSFNDLIDFVLKHFLLISVSIFLIGILIKIGLFLLILPGIYAMTRLAIVPYLQCLDGIKIKESFQVSFEFSKKNTWIIFSSILIIYIPILFFVLLQKFISSQLVVSLISIFIHLLFIIEVILIYHFYIDIKENMKTFFGTINNSE